MASRGLEARVRKLKEVHGTEPLTIFVRLFGSDRPAGEISIDGEPLARRAHETQEQYRARAQALAPVSPHGIRILHEVADGSSDAEINIRGLKP